MADFTALKTAIQNAIKQNGNEEITGNLLQEVLLAIVTTLGDGSINELITALGSEETTRGNADTTLQQNIDAEAQARGNADSALGTRIDDEITARENADNALGTRIDDEATARGNADTALQNAINAINTKLAEGYVYVGIATTSTNPSTPSGKVFYIAVAAGTYTNFLNGSSQALVLTQGINILKFNGTSWAVEQIWGVDDEPTVGNNNLIKSEGVKIEIEQIKGLITSTNPILQKSGIQWFYIPLKIKSGQTVKVKSTGSATVGTFRIYGNEFTQNTLGFTSINQEVTYTPQNDIYRLVIYITDCSVAGSFTVEISYANSINSIEKDVEEIKEKVNVINSQFFIGDASEFNKRIKEFYINGLDKQQDYRISFTNYNNGNIQIWLFRESDNIAVAAVGQSYNPPIIRLTPQNNSGIYGYAVVNIDANDTSNINAIINKEKCCNLENSPIIKSYLNNIIKDSDCDAGYLKPNGDFQSSTGFFTTKFLNIRNRDNIFCYNTCAGNGSVYIGYALYDKDFTCLSAVTVAQTDDNVIAWQGGSRASYVISNIPSNAKYIRVSYGDTNNTFRFLPSIIQDITQKSLDESENNLIEIINERTSPLADYSSFKNSGTITQNGYVLLPSVHIQRNSILSAKIKGSIEEVQIGVGYIEATVGHPNYRGYNAVWIKLTPTKAQLFVNYSEAQAGTEYTHGLNLTNNTTVVITSQWDGNTETKTLQIYDEFGNMFETGLSWWGMGRPYVQNLGNASVDVELAFMPQDITRSLWVFGDSYLTLGSDQAWIYYIFAKGIDKFLLNQRPGESPDEAWNDLNNLVNINYKPRVLLWCLGMNGDGVEQLIDGQYVINTYQKTYIDNVVALCTEKGITPVFCTIPTVPTLQKTGLSNYVRNLGYQYVDVANAVGAQSDGTWYAGLLRADGVHPTAAGSKVIASRVLLDFSAIGVNG